MRYIKSIFALLALVLTTSCIVDNVDYQGAVSSSDAITVMGRMTRFTDCDVTTRSAKDPDTEGKISSMALAIFKVNDEGNGLDGGCVHYEYSANQQELLFTIDRGDKFVENKRYAMYVFCNMPGMGNFDVGSTLDAMLKTAYDVESNLNIPQKGFPMIGSLGDTFSTAFERDNQEFIISPSTTPGNLTAPTVKPLGGVYAPQTLLTIPMKAVYAKVNFSISVDPDQTITGNYPPQFTISGYKVMDIPNSVDFHNETDATGVIAELNGGGIDGSLIAKGSTSINFSFYLPEQLLTPNKSIDDVLPSKLKKGKYDTAVDKDQNGYRDEDEKYHQRFKSKLVEGQNATHIVISGTYLDHQNHSWDVNYTVYLGKNNTDNFEIVRNFEYNNVITIRGIQSSSDMSDNQEGIAVDHRVNVSRTQPAIISLRRETLLDSHFEIRPMRIRKSENVNEATVTHALVKVNYNGNVSPWIGLERKSTDGGSNAHLSTGKRKYFTTDLVTSTLAGSNSNYSDNKGQQVVVPIQATEEIVWIYVDECTLIGDDVRTADISITYGVLNGSQFTPTTNTAYPPVDYTINQRYLFPVKYGNNTYYIEYEEEYLHNFDADDSYGSTEDEGMPWGLNGEDLSKISKKHTAILFGAGGLDSFTSTISSKVMEYSPYYDFYLSRDLDQSNWSTDISKIVHTRAGFDFCDEIIDVIGINVLALDQKPQSAIEYCYNRNKRDVNGNVVMGTNSGWYLPAIDEIEEIVMSTYESTDTSGNTGTYQSYARFEDFRAKFYWSSQPAYKYNYMDVNRTLGDRYGVYMVDNPEMARATKVVFLGGDPSIASNYDRVKSGLKDELGDDNDTYVEGSGGLLGTKDQMTATAMAFKYIYVEMNWRDNITTGPIERDIPASPNNNFSGGNNTVEWSHTIIAPEYNDGARLRTSKARVRCVRKL